MELQDWRKEPRKKYLVQIVGSFAEFERAMLRERTKSGLAAARQDGVVDGDQS
ncbi:transposon Tn21 resolvase [Escherichia coli]|uniref:Transposon Tn21 resolvase n=1 Tax=Escherichia coli TaxID=562 RepID=A0A376JXX7_ECOLX|nr:recombinase family protein [Escherichia coli]MDS1493412.1 recombinase family protein [Escherichia coli]STE75012.1 transposon Tn21 resolvase [Escherichia coli]